MIGDKNASRVIEELFAVIESSKGKDSKTSYTAKLFATGRGGITKKFGEEAVETVVAALSESPDQVIRESADLLYHLLVLWAEVGIEPNQVWAELESRKGVSGLDEKASRPGDGA